MSPSSDTPFRVAVSDLQSGVRRSEHVEAIVDWALEMSDPEPGAPLVADVALEGVSGGVYVHGAATMRFHSACQRCLVDFAHEEKVSVAEVVGPGAEYELDGDVLDLEPLLRDAMLAALPDSPQCRPDCRGLCPVCGADLNTDSCPGHDEEPDTPFAALRDLLQP